MKIAIIGYGKMGKEIEILARHKQHEIVAIIDNNEDWKTLDRSLQQAEVAIEFTTPECAFDNIMRCFALNIPVVSGTTGWFDRLPDVIDYCLKHNQTFFYGSNFSIGVNIFFEINRHLAELMNAHPDYEVFIEETHHIHKLDSPSGTAITLANDIIKHMERKSNWVSENQNKNELLITSVRESDIPGTHIVKYDSSFDKIEIIHTAKNRKGFALGAILAAEWVVGKKGVFQMKDLLFNS